MRRLPFVIAAALLFGTTLGAQAQWVWRDGQGRTHMSDMPPPRDVPDSAISRRPTKAAPATSKTTAAPAPAASAVAGAASGAGNGLDPALAARRKQAEDELQAQRKAAEAKNAAIRSDNCQRAQEQMRSLDSGMRMSRVNPQGEREVIDDAQRAAEAQRVRAVIASDCRG